MRIVGRNHESTLHGLIESLLSTTLRHSDTLEHHRQERTCSPLFGLRPRLLIIEDSQHFGRISRIGINHSLKPRITHRQVVESAR